MRSTFSNLFYFKGKDVVVLAAIGREGEQSDALDLPAERMVAEALMVLCDF